MKRSLIMDRANALWGKFPVLSLKRPPNVYLFDPQTHKLLWNKTFPNTAQGIARLLGQTPATSPWALEPTSRYSTSPTTLARQAGRKVLLAPPKKAQQFLQTLV